ncbi:MAG TPA: toluene tolerance protein [Gammaproteobacteria bacterium]|nr:toluene tolerance protein [Gammaproteobacteria bacterium]|tara:strand:- start:185 stop:808 length:624 start_codon:yes stop_codon:yes gene_type:complete
MQKTLTVEEYRALREGVEIVANDPFGDKVLRLENGNYLKLFRVKRFVSFARFWSYSRRFAYNARRLADLDIIVPEIFEICRISSIRRSGVIYKPLEGMTLRDIGSTLDEETILNLGSLYKQLHEKGIYHRSLHLGNVVLNSNKELGLIDIADLSIYWGRLPKRLRIRNFRHLSRYEEHRRTIAVHCDAFVEGLKGLDELYVRKLFVN